MFRGFVALLLSTSMRLLTNMVLFILMARAWGAEPFGQFMYLISVSALFTLLCEYGFTQQILKEVGGDPARVDECLGEFITAKFLLTLVSGIGALVYIVAVGLPLTASLTLLLLLAANTILSYADFFLTFLKAKTIYAQETRVTIIGNAILFLLAVVCIFAFTANALIVALAFLGARAIHLFLAVSAYRRFISSVIHIQWRFGRAFQTVKTSFPYGIDVAVGVAFANMDGILVSNTLGYAANGVYQAAARFYQGASLLPPLFAGLFLPQVARARAAGDDPEARRLINNMYYAMVGIGVVALICFFLSKPLIAYLYQSTQLRNASDLMPLFGVLVLVRFVAAAQGITVTVLGGQAIRAGLFTAALAVLLVLGIFLLRQIGLPGIVLASGIAYALLSMAFWMWIDSKGYRHRKMMLPLHAAAAVFFFVYCGQLAFK